MAGTHAAGGHAGTTAKGGSAGKASAGTSGAIGEAGEGGAPEGGTGGGSAGSAGASTGGTGGGGTSGGGTGGVVANGGTSGGGTSGGGTSGGGMGGTTSATLTLTSADVNVVGRTGNSVRFSVTGQKPASTGLAGIAVTFEDGQNAPIKFFDSNFDGVPDATEGRLVFDAPVTDGSFTGVATLTGVASKDIGKLVKATVTLVASDDQRSSSIDADVVMQSIAHLGDSCDPANILNRCDVGMSCTGVPTQCASGTAPVIAELKFLHAPGGPLILVRGTDPDDDMGSFHVELLNSSGQPINVDIENSGTPENAYDIAPQSISSQGSFFSSTQSSSTALDTQVPKIRVTPMDLAGHSGAPQTTSMADVSKNADGQACDARGFSGCVDGDVCAPGLPVAAGTCSNASAVRQSQCGAAAKLDPIAGPTFTSGQIAGVSLWEPPALCTTPGNIGRPEAVVELHLSAVAKKLVISTERPETAIDTVVYLLPGCANDSSKALGCNDDDPDAGGFASKLTLSNVPAGDYTIIVESGQMPGGPFGLVVSTQ